MSRVQREAEELEREREEVRRRYNDTPLRRILKRQAFWGDRSHANVVGTVLESEHPDIERNRPRIEEPVEKNGKRGVEDNGTFDDAAEDVVVERRGKREGASVESIRTVVSSKGSPLRRILQRQGSSNVTRRC